MYNLIFLPIFVFAATKCTSRFEKNIIYNISIIAIFLYWVTYPLESLAVGSMVLGELNIKQEGMLLFALFSFSFLIGFKIFKRLKVSTPDFLKNSLFSSSYILILSLTLSILAFIWFFYAYNFSLVQYLSGIFDLSRIFRMEGLSSSSKGLPYSVPFLLGVSTWFLYIKRSLIQKIKIKWAWASLIFIINLPISLSYLIEGERTSLIKYGMTLILINEITKEQKNLSVGFLERNSLKINLNMVLKRIKTSILIFFIIILLTLIGLARGGGWVMSQYIGMNLQNRGINNLPVAEFRAVNYTVDYALYRDEYAIDSDIKAFTWDKIAFYPLPRYIYKVIFKERKPLNLGDAIGESAKYFSYNSDDIYRLDKKLGFGLSPVAEGYINFGYLGVLIIGIIYGGCIGVLHKLYNKININSIGLGEIIIICSASVTPLIMRSGMAGLYNWIFSIILILLVISNAVDIIISKRN
tara:strand:+ start:57 stop:1457 length:1401 start_codon:yes stop_codon:yes gene_type:complete